MNKGLTSIKDFLKYSSQTKLIFGFVYTDNPENRLRNRTGTFSGWREGTRSFSYIENAHIPIHKNKDKDSITYYDINRVSWRKFKGPNFVKILYFWNEKEKDWKSTPEEAGLNPSFTLKWFNVKRTTNKLPKDLQLKKRMVELKTAELRRKQIAQNFKNNA